MKAAHLFQKKVPHRKEVIQRLYDRSVEIVLNSQLGNGGTIASVKGSRYGVNVYPRDHAYAVMALTSAGKFADARQGLNFILNVELSPEGMMAQRYGENQKASSNKPPQIDGNALSLIAAGDYLRKSKDTEFIERHTEQIRSIAGGIVKNLNEFDKGSLVFGVNGNIEFSPYEEGYEIYTNTCSCKALAEAAEILDDKVLSTKSDDIRDGIANYLYIPEYGGFIPLVRREPNPSIVNVANLTAFLALTDLEIFPIDDKRIEESIKFHLMGTWNEEMGGYNRYAASIGRHNFGNGPWPREMLRLVSYFAKIGKKDIANKILDWVLNVALLNEDYEMGLPEHVVSNDELMKEYKAFMRTFDINPREERVVEYKRNIESKMYKKHKVCYPVNPLIWSHSLFITVWNEVKTTLS
jgi:GH15 family glucan-1,4-alpha-glucosidase